MQPGQKPTTNAPECLGATSRGHETSCFPYKHREDTLKQQVAAIIADAAQNRSLTGSTKGEFRCQQTLWFRVDKSCLSRVGKFKSIFESKHYGCAFRRGFEGYGCFFSGIIGALVDAKREVHIRLVGVEKRLFLEGVTKRFAFFG